MGTKTAKAALSTLLMLCLAGCGASNNSAAQNNSETSSEIKAATQVDHQAIEKVNTLFSMTPSAYQAKEKAVAQCISEQGLTWQARPAPQTYDIRTQVSPASLSVEEAQQYGYQKPANNQAEGQAGIDDVTWAAYTGNSDNGGVTVEGIPGAIASDGCLAKSYEIVFGSPEAGVLFEGGILNLPLPYVNAALDDAKMAELDKQWSTCMKDQHHIEIASPALATIDTSMDSHQLAIYDAQCRQDVEYEKVTADVLNAYLTTFLSDQEGVIDQLTQAKQTAEKNAPAILNS